MKRKKLLSVLVAAALSLSCFTAVPIVSQAAASTSSETENEVYIRAAGFDVNWDGVTNIAQFKGPDGKLCYAINSDDFVTVYKK